MIGNNALPTCNELAAYYGVAFNANNLSTISLTDDICNKLSIGMSVNIVNHGESLIIIPLFETMNISGTCAYIVIGNIGSSSWGIKFGTCFFSNTNKNLIEFTSSNTIDIY